MPLLLVAAIAMGDGGRKAWGAGPPARLSAVGGVGEVVVTWERALDRDVAYYLVYRAEGRDPDLKGDPFEMVKGLRFVDGQVVPGLEYRYVVVPVERSGGRMAPTAVVAARANAFAAGPRIASVSVEPSGRALRAGDAVTVTLVGASGARATAEIGALAQEVPLREQGRSGRYVGTYTLRAKDQGVRRAGVRVVGHLTGASGTSDLAGPEVQVAGRGEGRDKAPPVIARASHDGWKVAGFSGKLVAGDVLTVTLEGEPGGTATFEIPGVVGASPLREGRPGAYAASYTVRWSDRVDEAPVLVRLADGAGNEARAQAGRPLAFDTRVRLTVVGRDATLPADNRSETRVVVHAANANGEEVSGHEIAASLVDPEEPLGGLRPAEAGDLRIKWGGVTDAFGDVVAAYRVGRTAGTWLVVAKDLTTGDAGVGWVSAGLTPQGAARAAAKPARAGREAARHRTTEAPLGPGAPAEAQVRRAAGSVFVPRLYEGQERERVQVAEWLAEAGDEVTKGQALLVLETQRGAWRITSPAAGTLRRPARAERDRVELGEVLGLVEIDPEVWRAGYRR